jgi:hypothetical protein
VVRYNSGDEQEVYFGFNERTRLATNLFPIESDMNSICHSRRQEERAKPRASLLFVFMRIRVVTDPPNDQKWQPIH